MKIVIKLAAFIAIFSFAQQGITANIAFGKLEQIKVYDQSNSKVTKLIFSADATHQNVSGCDLTATITHSKHSDKAIDQMMSIALAAYMGDRKVRAFSSENVCELDFLAIQQ